MASHLRILFVDAYDSFSNNIIALLETLLNVEISKVNIDLHVTDISAFLQPFAAIICGPGPGHPENRADVGLFQDIWELEACHTIPVLGICLGFQSLVFHFGGNVQRLSPGRHGIETDVETSSCSIFVGLTKFKSVQYHSLHATLGHRSSGCPDADSLWEPSECCPKLIPLAWEFGTKNEGTSAVDDHKEPILMAVRHVLKPYYGIQFHPESVCSQSSARRVVMNWWDVSKQWLQHHKPARITILAANPPKALSDCISESSDDEQSDLCSRNLNPQTPPTPTSSISISSLSYPPQKLVSTEIQLGCLTVPTINEALRLEAGEMILLDSEMRPMPSLGEYSILGIIEPSTLRIKYSIGTDFLVVQEGLQQTQVNLGSERGGIFGYLKAFMSEREILDLDDRAFCGGLMGYITYEACLETIGVPAARHEYRPDIHFAYVKKSIVLDHKRDVLDVQCLKEQGDNDVEPEEWVRKTTRLLMSVAEQEHMRHPKDDKVVTSTSVVSCYQPLESEYKHKVSHCQEQIRAGNAYELCLSDQTSIHVMPKESHTLTPWARYLRLREANPAPFAAYVRLDGLTLLSTSPERFMSWSRFEENTSLDGHEQSELVSTCQFRPIKGTVSKQRNATEGSVEYVSREEAARLLSVVKERAENLMIVDLIRHDLYSVVSSWDVEVKSLMAVEEYETVYQLVSVIEGKLFKPLRSTVPSLSSQPRRRYNNKTGIDVLAASLPPGSMTGAPKLRSCRLLQDIEQHQPRSVYSGILGYMCVSGKGDFSVVIRSVFKWDDSSKDGVEEHWRIGAGGAVTGLSTEDGEWEEMLAKLKSTLGGFAYGKLILLMRTGTEVERRVS